MADDSVNFPGLIIHLSTSKAEYDKMGLGWRAMNELKNSYVN